MDKKALVRLLRPIFQSLQQTGLIITDVELLPISLKGYYTLAVSADWPVNMTTMDKIKMIRSRIFEFIPVHQRHFIESVFLMHRQKNSNLILILSTIIAPMACAANCFMHPKQLDTPSV